MFSLFKKTSLIHPLLGQINYARDTWQGNSAHIFACENLAIKLPGTKDGPDTAALQALLSLQSSYATQQIQLAEILFHQHYAHGKAAYDAGEFVEAGADYPEIKTADEIWSYLHLLSVRISQEKNDYRIELIFSADWDIEHQLGFSFVNNSLQEFCASVGP